MTSSTIRQGVRAAADDPRPTAVVIPLRTGAGWAGREPAGVRGPTHGQILLFTGVRYERLPEAETGIEPASAQRRHS